MLYATQVKLFAPKCYVYVISHLHIQSNEAAVFKSSLENSKLLHYIYKNVPAPSFVTCVQWVMTLSTDSMDQHFGNSVVFCCLCFYFSFFHHNYFKTLPVCVFVMVCICFMENKNNNNRSNVPT